MANEGNQFWKQRSKHGRDTLFSSGQLLWEAACEYFKWVDENPLYNNEVSSFQGQIIWQPVPIRRPYTWEGLALYVGCATNYFRAFRHKYKEDEDKEDLLMVISMIEQCIMHQQVEGAQVGHFKEQITARYLGLKDKVEASTPADGEGEFKVTLKL